MITSKQRARLRSMSNGYQSVTQIGKLGVSDTLIESLETALTAHEMIKVTVLENSGLDTYDTANGIAASIGADVVSVVGRKFVLYRESSDKDKRKISPEIKKIK